MNITKKQQENYLKKLLTTNAKAATKALMHIYNNQTGTEKAVGKTVDHNGVGFTGADAEILTSFAEQFKQRGSLSQKQMSLLFKKIGKYWRQILMVSDVEKLNKSILRKEGRV